MRREYGKLIRDRIPAIIKAAGKRHGLRVLEEATYRGRHWQPSWSKQGRRWQRPLVSGTCQEQVKELADVYEVLGTLLTTTGITHEEVAAVQAGRHEERSGFAERLWLLWVEADKG